MREKIRIFLQSAVQFLTDPKRKKAVRITLLFVLLLTMVFSAVSLIRYLRDEYTARQASRELREILDAEAAQPSEPSLPIGAEAARPSESSPPIVIESLSSSPEADESMARPEAETLTEAEMSVEPQAETLTAAQAPIEPEAPVGDPGPGSLSTPPESLPKMIYPANPESRISDRFRSLRKENRDIVGWLTIDRLIDEPVVQRDHVFYLNHDVRRNENVNGAVFLDAAVQLKNSRPYALILYGHNMKSGAMFGSLRNYESSSFYHSNPWIRFESLYEEGKYVIFSVGTMSTVPERPHYVDVFAMTSRSAEAQQKAIDALISLSVHPCGVDVQPGDQLLLLVTCVSADEDRRVVAARRLRDGENEQELLNRIVSGNAR